MGMESRLDAGSTTAATAANASPRHGRRQHELWGQAHTTLGACQASHRHMKFTNSTVDREPLPPPPTAPPTHTASYCARASLPLWCECGQLRRVGRWGHRAKGRGAGQRVWVSGAGRRIIWLSSEGQRARVRVPCCRPK